MMWEKNLYVHIQISKYKQVTDHTEIVNYHIEVSKYITDYDHDNPWVKFITSGHKQM